MKAFGKIWPVDIGLQSFGSVNARVVAHLQYSVFEC